MKYLNKIIEYLLYFLIFLLPVQTRWIIKAGDTEYSTYSLYGTDILLLVILSLFIILKILNNEPRATNREQRIWLLIKGLVLISAVSIFFAFDKQLALYKFGWLILGVGLFWLIIKANYSKIKLIYALLAGIFLQTVLGIWQFLIQSSFNTKWLGIASHNAIDLGTSVVETIGADGAGERWLRAYGGFDHPNMLGGVITMAILFLIILLIAKSKTSNFSFIIFYFLLLIFSAALFFSFSRTAWLGLFVGLVVIIILAIFSKNLWQQKQLVKIILTMGVLFFILFSQCQNLIITRVKAEGRLEVKSTTERLMWLKGSWWLIKQNWLAGVGIGNYGLGIRKYESKIINNAPAWRYQPVHNVFFLVWGETGIIGLIFFIGIIIYLIILNLKIFRQNHENQISVILNLSILLALIILLNFDHWLWSLHFGALFFWLIMGMVYKQLLIETVDK